MKKINSNLFDKKATLSKVEMGSCQGGNNSDKKYVDSKIDGGGWGIDVKSVIDFVPSTSNLDQPDKEIAGSCYLVAF
ncbi:MAG: hypothetical protein LBQ31_06625 [Bacteroidales bacterium]|jgi:hypothetical protein|nr:hypothetical protein [Bacteroidales bacterium]